MTATVHDDQDDEDVLDGLGDFIVICAICRFDVQAPGCVSLLRHEALDRHVVHVCEWCADEIVEQRIIVRCIREAPD